MQCLPVCCWPPLSSASAGSLLFQLEKVLRVEAAQREEEGSLVLVELRRRFEDDEKAYRCKLQAYQEGQQRQAQLVQRLQNKVGACTRFRLSMGNAR